MQTPKQPLAGIRVIDLTRVLSGPFCTMLLGDMGADVVKIEGRDGGDPVRGQGSVVDGLSWYFAAFNRNKRSLVLDLRKEEGKAVLARLLAGADVLVENFRPGVLGEMGFSEERLAAINPRLVVASVNGYGSQGPYVDRPAFDFIAQAMSGFMAATGEPDGEPMRAAPPITDLIAGLYCAFGIVAALHTRERDGHGQRVEAAMVNSMVSMMAYLASGFLAEGKVAERTGNDHPIAAPYGLFRAADGDIAIAPPLPRILERFMAELGLAHLLSQPEYATPARRHARRHELRRLVDARLATDTQANWIARLNEAGVPCGKVMDIGEVLGDPQIAAQEMVIDVPHPGHGDVRMVGFPVKLSATPCAVRLPAPALGEHTREILAEAGLSPEELSDLSRNGVI
jgi:CoA:oxalate CoA-transferase